MNVLVEIGHPAHVHFFAKTIKRLEQLGHTVLVVTRNKEITNDLLDRLEIPYRCLSRPAEGKIGKFLELFWRWFGIARILRRRSIDLAVSISGISTSFPSKICRVRNIIFTDNEDAWTSNRISFPFADKIYTPEYYLQAAGKRHRRYAGLHELAYLQNFDFDEAKKVRDTLKLPNEYVIVRLVANDAVHDRGLLPISDVQLKSLLITLSKAGKVFVTSQGAIPEKFQEYALQIPIEKIHAVLAGARLFAGDSPTMAVESAILGTPALLATARTPHLGNMQGLEHEGLLKNFLQWDGLISHVQKISNFDELKKTWMVNAKEFRSRMPDMGTIISNAIESELRCAEL